MPRQDPERLKKYLEMITRKKGGIEKELAERPRGQVPGGLESLEISSTADLARNGLERVARGQAPTESEMSGLEAIILPDLRPAVDVIDGKFQMTHPLWRRMSDDTAIRARVEATFPSIGRIELPGNKKIPYGGTGFVVGNGLIMTNRHVAEIFTHGVGDRRLSFIDGAKAGIDFRREYDRPTGPTLTVQKVVMIHPYWDMAILAVDNLPGTCKPLKLSLLDARDLIGHDIFVVGYPAFDYRNPTDVQQDVMNGRYGVKKLQPGELQNGVKTSSFGKIVPAATHDCSTLGGNSGSAVVDLDTGDVLALHFGGRYQEKNYAVPASELARDSRVIDAGVVFAGTPKAGSHEWSAWWQDADAMEASTIATTDAKTTDAKTTDAKTVQSVAASSTAGPSNPATQITQGSVRIEVPLVVTISLGAQQVAAPQTAAPRVEAVEAAPGLAKPELAELEALVEPDHNTDYDNRKGYDPNFLDVDGEGGAVAVPMPEAAKPQVLAKTRSGDDVLRYQNFSIRMHAQRRLALVTASNVTKERKLRKPDPDEDYTRRGLSGLGENDQERWFLDERLDAKFQLPDVFFTKDRKAFDKGHIVRRDDVAWGKTYAALRRANGDSYHVTNCSPQVAGFNRSGSGDDNWGDLENHVLSEAASERLCVFAGPVLDDADEVFTGKGDGGAVLRAKIPSRFWKVIVARTEDGIGAYGFILEQDLSQVEWEFAVPPEFVPAMVALTDIENAAGVAFDRKLHNADQYDSARGAEIAVRSGARRKRRTKPA